MTLRSSNSPLVPQKERIVAYHSEGHLMNVRR